jgi:hypothetical protein
VLIRNRDHLTHRRVGVQQNSCREAESVRLGDSEQGATDSLVLAGGVDRHLFDELFLSNRGGLPADGHESAQRRLRERPHPGDSRFPSGGASAGVTSRETDQRLLMVESARAAS